MQKDIEIYVDGSRCDNNGKLPQAGWGLYIPELELEHNGKLIGSSVPRAELTAIIQALKYVARQKAGRFIIYSDNKGITDCFLGYSSRRSNEDLWNRVYDLIKEISEIPIEVKIAFYERNLSNPKQVYANKADQLAFYAANKLL